MNHSTYIWYRICSRSAVWLFHVAQPVIEVMTCEMFITAGSCTGFQFCVCRSQCKRHEYIGRGRFNPEFFYLLAEQLLTVSIMGTWFN